MCTCIYIYAYVWCDVAAFFFQGTPDLTVIIEEEPNIFLIIVEV